MSDDAKSLVTAAAEAGIGLAGGGDLLTFAKALFGRSSQGKINSAIAQLGLEQTILENLRAGIASEVRAHLEDLAKSGLLAQISEKFEEAPTDEKPTASDLLLLARSIVEKIESTSDRKKRRILVAALVNGFDPEIYTLGVTERLLRIIDELTYGDVITLRHFGEHGSLPYSEVVKAKSGHLDRVHVDHLCQLGLLEDGTKRAPLHIVLNYSITSLGEAMLALIREAPKHVASE